MGMVRRFFQDSTIPNLPFLIGGVFLFGLQYLRINEYKEQAYRLMLLASVLIFTVIFSSGSESPTYIIAFVGVAIDENGKPRVVPSVITDQMKKIDNKEKEA